jgi:hypothetical protein
MLQHNTTLGRVGAATRARRAHAAHAAVVGSHVLCCGAPIALALAAAGAGASIGLTGVVQWFSAIHAFVHAHELWVLALSAGFVVVGGVLEVRAHGGRRISALFALSLLCFTLNAGLIAVHRSVPAPGLVAEAPRH